MARRLPERSGPGRLVGRVVHLFRDRKRRRPRVVQLHRRTRRVVQLHRRTRRVVQLHRRTRRVVQLHRRTRSARRRRALVHAVRARVRLGQVPGADPSAAPPRHLRVAVSRAGILDQGRDGCVHATRAPGAAGAGHRQVARVGQCRAGAGLAGAARFRAGDAQRDRRVCARHGEGNDVPDLLRNGRHRARRAVHAHRGLGRAAVPWIDGRSLDCQRSPVGRVRPALSRQVAAARARHSRIVAA